MPLGKWEGRHKIQRTCKTCYIFWSFNRLFGRFGRLTSKFADRFKELKKESGLSDLKLSKLLNVSPMTICRWENAVHDIKSNELVKVAKFFGVSADYLIGLED